ncbi:MAG: purine-nucleoside phosphorylase [Candidatus Kapaibacterium sp.]
MSASSGGRPHTRSWYAHTDAMRAAVDDAAAVLMRMWQRRFHAFIIAGSGVSAAFRTWEHCRSVGYEELPGFITSAVHGHANRISWMRVDGDDVLVFHGRRHLYEGAELRDAVAPVLLAQRMGAVDCVLTNAAGGLSPTLASGDIMVATDLMNGTWRGVVASGNGSASLVDAAWSERTARASAAATTCGIGNVRRGVYVSVLGPSYETRAEVRMYARFADAIGMSTIHEAQTAVQLGMSVVAISVISNTLHGTETTKLTHDEVLQTAADSAARLGEVLAGALRTRGGNHAG